MFFNRGYATGVFFRRKTPVSKLSKLTKVPFEDHLHIPLMAHRGSFFKKSYNQKMHGKTAFCEEQGAALRALSEVGPILGTCCALWHVKRPNATDSNVCRLPVIDLAVCRFRAGAGQIEVGSGRCRSVNRYPVV
jgi:hypothetical protein